MKQPNSTQQIFLVRFIETAEQHAGMRINQRGFITAAAKSLDFRNTSIVTRWLQGSVPSGRHLVTIYEKWHVRPDYLLGIER